MSRLAAKRVQETGTLKIPNKTHPALYYVGILPCISRIFRTFAAQKRMYMEQQVIPSDYTQYAEALEIIKHAIER